MPRLIARSATEGLLPVAVGALTLSDATPARLTAIAPYPGAAAEVQAALVAAGLGWPAAGTSVPGSGAAGGQVLLWAGRDQAFLAGGADLPPGPAAALSPHAAVTDLSDGWVGLSLAGPGLEAVLARLVALDLAPDAFPVGATARTGLGHMMALLHRTGAEAVTLYVFRSMVRTAVHELGEAMARLAARAGG